MQKVMTLKNEKEAKRRAKSAVQREVHTKKISKVEERKKSKEQREKKEYFQREGKKRSATSDGASNNKRARK